MSLGLWEFFWGWGGGAPPPPPAPTAAPTDPGAGGGRSREDYFPANDDFWSAREAYLRSLQEEMALELPQPAPRPDIPPAPSPSGPQFGDWKQLPRLAGERTAAIASVESALDAKQLQARAARLRELNAAISRARRAQLDFDRYERVTKRNKQLRRAKRTLGAAMATQLLLQLLARS